MLLLHFRPTPQPERDRGALIGSKLSMDMYFFDYEEAEYLG
jgi:hypothetical protein